MSVLPGQLSLDLERTASLAPEHHDDARPVSGRPRRGNERRDGAPAEQQLLSVAEVSRITGLSANAVYRAIWSGELSASKLRGRLRVRGADVDAWVVAGRVAPPRAEPEPQRRPERRRPAGSGRGLRELLEAGVPPR